METSLFLSLALDLAHCCSISGAWHEVSCPYAQPGEGQYVFLTRPGSLIPNGILMYDVI